MHDPHSEANLQSKSTSPPPYTLPKQFAPPILVENPADVGAVLERFQNHSGSRNHYWLQHQKIFSANEDVLHLVSIQNWTRMERYVHKII